MSNRIHISCSAERNYLKHSAAMLASALAHRGDRDVEILYLHPPRFPKWGRERLTRMVKNAGAAIIFREVPNELIEGLETRGFTGKATWYRIFLPSLAAEVDRTLWLDVDTLTMRDLGELWDTDLRGNYVGAVTNIFQENHLPRADKLGIAPRDYFNAGIALLDLNLIRRDGVDGELIRVAHDRSKRLSWRDQDTLNLALGHRRHNLHPRWNCMNSVIQFDAAATVFGERAVAEARRDPAIRHFEGPGLNKPWHEDAAPQDRAAYAKARARTPWPRVRLEGSRPRDQIRAARANAERLGVGVSRRLLRRHSG